MKQRKKGVLELPPLGAGTQFVPQAIPEQCCIEMNCSKSNPTLKFFYFTSYKLYSDKEHALFLRALLYISKSLEL